MSYRRLITASTGLALLFGAMPSVLSAQQAPAAAAEPEEQVVVVTGSRIAGNPLNTPQPVVAVTSEDFQAAGATNAIDLLDSLPALQASTSVDQSVLDGDVAGRIALNLRGLGTNRTLVLVNGRRHVSGTPGSAAVDISSIPTGMIERVDVLTGGASAIYGSDAVTGVVNFITRTRVEGTEVDAQLGLSQYGDAGRGFVSIVHGDTFAGEKGYFTLAGQYEVRDGIEYKDRSWARNNGVPHSRAPNPG